MCLMTTQCVLRMSRVLHCGVWMADDSIIHGTRVHGKIQLYRICWAIHRLDYLYVGVPTEQSCVPIQVTPRTAEDLRIQEMSSGQLGAVLWSRRSRNGVVRFMYNSWLQDSLLTPGFLTLDNQSIFRITWNFLLKYRFSILGILIQSVWSSVLKLVFCVLTSQVILVVKFGKQQFNLTSHCFHRIDIDIK